MDTSKKIQDISAAVMTSINLAVQIVPGVGPIVSIASPILKRLIDRGMEVVFKTNTTEIERARLGVAYVNASGVITENLNSGKKVINTSFKTGSSDIYTKADELIEASLRHTVRDAENEKASLYGNFLGNIPFTEASSNELVQYNAILSELSIF